MKAVKIFALVKNQIITCICKQILPHNRICTEAIAQDKLVLEAVIILALVEDTEL